MYTQEDANQVFAMMVAAQGKDEAYTRLSELIDQSENVEARQLMSNAALLYFRRDLNLKYY